MIQELQKKGFEIKSAASTLRSMLAEFKETGDLKAFAKIKITKNGKEFDFSDFVAQMPTTFADLGTLPEIIENVALDKEVFKSEKEAAELNSAAIMNTGTKLIESKGKNIEKIELFMQTPNISFNELDFKMFENFRAMNGGLLYKDSKNRVHRLFINSKGGIDIKGEIFSSNDDSMLNELKKDIYLKYETYCKTANVAWHKMNEESRLEDIFDVGFKFEDCTYAVPTIMRYFIQPQVVYRLTAWEADDGKGKKTIKKGQAFDHFEAVSKNGSMLFDDQLDILSMNWNKMTKGLITTSVDWKPFSNTDEWALNMYKIPEDWENAKMPECWRKFFDGKAAKRILMRVFFYIGSCLDAENMAQQALIITDKGGTGKGEFVRLLQDILGPDMIGRLTNESLNNPRFSVFSHGLYKHHILINTEYDGKSCNTELFKQLIGGDTISCEVKGGESFEFDARGLKMILTSNRICYMKEHAIRRRLIPASFTCNFDNTKGMTEKEKMELRAQGKEFFAYCYKVYKKCPFRKSTGEYIVMNPKQEEKFLEDRTLPDDYEAFLMKAFSEDPDIGDKFRCGDPTTETHLNDDFEAIYETLFEYSDNKDDVIPVADFKKAIVDFIFTDEDNRIAYSDTFDFIEIEKDVFAFANMKRNQNSQFIAYLEKTKGHVYNDTRRDGNKLIKVITNIKFKPDGAELPKEGVEMFDED